MKRVIIILCLMFFQNELYANKLPIQQWQTHRGALALFIRTTQLPMLDVQVAFKAGSAYDDQKPGLAMITANLMDQGAGGLNATQLAEKFEAVGAEYGVDVDRDKAFFSLRTLTRKHALKQAINTFISVISQPDFPSEAIQREKKQLLTLINHFKEKPQTIADDTFYHSIYREHPYAHSPFGTPKAVTSITKEQIVAFYKTHYTPNNAVIAIVGNLTLTEARSLAEKISLHLPQNHQVPPIPSPHHTANTKQTIHVNFPSNQTVLRIGQLGITHHDKAYFPLLVGNYTLGGGALVSRLASEIREKRGLTYGVYSSFNLFQQPGPFIISMATKTHQAQTAKSLVIKTLQQYLATGPTDTELKAAKNYIMGSFPLKLSSNKALVGILLAMGFYQLPEDYLDTYLQKVSEVTKEDIRNAFNQRLNTHQLIKVTVGK